MCKNQELGAWFDNNAIKKFAFVQSKLYSIASYDMKSVPLMQQSFQNRPNQHTGRFVAGLSALRGLENDLEFDDEIYAIFRKESEF